MEKSDIESGVVIGDKELYPKMTESPGLRWAFIRKVYAVLTLQLIVTVGVSSVVFFVGDISVFVTTTTPGLVVFFVSLVIPLLMLWPLIVFAKKHPVNLIILMLFTLTISFAVGLCCSFSKGKIVLEAAILTATMVLGLTIYTFWAVRRGHDFSFLEPFLFGALLIILVFSIIQVLHPLGKLSSMIFSCFASVVFCGYIVYDTNQLIKKLNYDEYIHAAICLYLDVINLFLHILGFAIHT
ncbi:Bax inhibitor-1 family protein [Raphanus sativus]|uniref:Protein LIFEGUARD 1 n=1 Tax=Raphanus sativus TaxID=3726 RepID=A0A6J0M8N5_RAPSA|nr:protein LIFEGUARD 1 [Raphanus sativus]KAJ4912279.1 Bax inhibitor-1 family protein [Raphanus sativus]